MSNSIARYVEEYGHVPLGWAAGSRAHGYLNLGDALSPAMVSMLTGQPVQHVASHSDGLRLAAVGSIGHNFVGGGEVWFWGTGSSRYVNPLSGVIGDKVPHMPPADTDLHITATRGPVSRAILSGGSADMTDPVYGDPVWMLPDFYPAPVEKKWDLGVIIHLVDLADRDFEAHPKPDYLRYVVPEEFAGSVRLINTVTPATVAGLREQLDEILSCRRLVSTSLHGMVFAESYGIPCLYFGVRGPNPGVATIALDAHDDKQIDPRVTDLYLGIGKPHLPIYVQNRKRPTDWAKLMTSIDSTWEPVAFDTARLAEACPVAPAPIAAPAGATIFDHPLIAGLPLFGGARTAPV